MSATVKDPGQLQRLDFTHPRKPRKTKWRALSKWHQGMCTLTAEQWNGLLSREVTITAGTAEPFQYRAAVSRFPDDGVGVHLQVGPSQFPSMIILTQRQLHGILADILNFDGTEWPPVRKFTRAESSMLEVMLRKFGHAIGESIPGPEATRAEFCGLIDKPDRTRLFSQINEVFFCEFSINSRFGAESGCWILPRTGAEELLGEEYPDAEPEDRGLHPTLETLARRIPVDIVVELGRCDVSMSQVSKLSVGDVLILEQPIHRPLTAYVAGERKWLGQPLRVGSRQAFEVVELITG